MKKIKTIIGYLLVTSLLSVLNCNTKNPRYAEKKSSIVS